MFRPMAGSGEKPPSRGLFGKTWAAVSAFSVLLGMVHWSDDFAAWQSLLEGLGIANVTPSISRFQAGLLLGFGSSGFIAVAWSRWGRIVNDNISYFCNVALSKVRDCIAALFGVQVAYWYSSEERSSKKTRRLPSGQVLNVPLRTARFPSESFHVRLRSYKHVLRFTLNKNSVQGPISSNTITWNRFSGSIYAFALGDLEPPSVLRITVEQYEHSHGASSPGGADHR